MSYADIGGSGGGGGGRAYGGYGGDADAEYIRLSQQVQDALGEILSNVSAMNGLVAKLNTEKDSPRLRDRL